MLIRISKTDGVPIYLQIVQQIEEMVICGVLPAGEVLPTVRSLAGQLVVNPNTVARSYRALERKGLLTARRGSGTRVASFSAKDSYAKKMALLRARVDDLVQMAERLGLEKKHVSEMLEGRGGDLATPLSSAWTSAFEQPFID